MDRSFWQDVIAADYAVPPGHSAASLTHELLAYLGSTDPELRDVFAYPILEHWIHGGQCSAGEVRTMAAQLEGNLTAGVGEQGTDSVFLRSFSALTLAEIVYEDNQHPFLAEAEVRHLLERALAYLPAERDLRGYVPGPGWAHAVAHGADLLWVLAQNRYLGAADLERVMEAIATKAAPAGAHIYLFNDDQRLVRAVLGVLQRDLLPLSFLSTWLNRLTHSDGRPIGIAAFFDGHPPAVASTDKIGLLHNTSQFLRGLYFHLAFDPDPPAVAADLLPIVAVALEPINAF